MNGTTDRPIARHRFTRRADGLCDLCGYTIGSITHAVQHSNVSMEYAVRKDMTIRCQCSRCGCPRRVKAAKTPFPACGGCLAGRHHVGGMTTRQMYR